MENTPAYSAKLAKICDRVLAQSAEISAASINECIVEMEQFSGGLMCTKVPLLPVAADLAAVRSKLTELEVGARQFLSELAAEQARLQAAISRYDSTLSAISAGVGECWSEADVMAPFEQFARAVKERAEQQATRLAEGRYERNEYRRMLQEDVLRSSELGTLESGMLESISAYQKQAWSQFAQEYNFNIVGTPVWPQVDQAGLVVSFFGPIQLEWERPSMLKSVWRARDRARFIEQLIAEIQAGLAQINATLRIELQKVAQELAKGWQTLVQSAAAAVLLADTGQNRAACAARLEQIMTQRQQIATWGEKLAAGSLENVFAQWSKGVQELVAERLAAAGKEV